MIETARYLLDTNVHSDPIRRPGGAFAERTAAVGEKSIATSIIVAAELRYGVQKSGSRRLVERIELDPYAISVLTFETPADPHYANIRDHLARQGTPIGPMICFLRGRCHFRLDNTRLNSADTDGVRSFVVGKSQISHCSEYGPRSVLPAVMSGVRARILAPENHRNRISFALMMRATRSLSRQDSPIGATPPYVSAARTSCPP